MTANGYRVSFWGDENVLELDKVIVAQFVCGYTKDHYIIYFKQVHFTVCKSYLNFKVGKINSTIFNNLEICP